MFQCKDLLSLTTMSQAKVVAGTGGMERGIRWSYKAENINFEKWVHGQELLIISGPVTQRKNFDLYRTIEKAIELKMSCALLLVGENYVTQIDEQVIDLAEKNDFPLFTMPWDVPLLDFFEELGHAISYLDDRKDIQDSLLAEIIFGNSINVHNIERKCQQMGQDISVMEQVFVLHPDNLSNDEVRSYAEVLKGLFGKKEYPAIISCYGDRMIGFIRDCSGQRELITEIFDEFTSFLQSEHEGICYTLNIGERCSSLSKLQKSFQETSKTNSILEHIRRVNEVVFYDQMGFYRLLISYENTEPMKRYVDEVLGEILAYDQKNHTQLVETMWAYFGSDCNLQRAADRLFSHKNTVKYRLSRIEQITGRDFDNRFQSQELYNALIIYYYIE